jgi:hypothetical protein
MDILYRKEVYLAHSFGGSRFIISSFIQPQVRAANAVTSWWECVYVQIATS